MLWALYWPEFIDDVDASVPEALLVRLNQEGLQGVAETNDNLNQLYFLSCPLLLALNVICLYIFFPLLKGGEGALFYFEKSYCVLWTNETTKTVLFVTGLQ